MSLAQLKVMSAIERCRTAASGGHVARCEKCADTQIAYNSCRNRHSPKCQGAAAKQWLADRQAELLRVPYFHVVFTLPAAVADIAYQNKAVVYDILFKVGAKTLITIAAEGITYEVLKEHDASLLPGVTKIIEYIFIMQPGTSIDFPDSSPSMNICTSMLGQVTVTMGGTTVVRRAGDQWTEPKGMPMALTYTGNVPYVDKTFEIFYE